MRYAWILIVSGLIMVIASQVSADGFFDSRQCKADCSFRFNIGRDWGGAIQLPADSVRREGYLQCLDECDKQSWQDTFGPKTD